MKHRYWIVAGGLVGMLAYVTGYRIAEEMRPEPTSMPPAVEQLLAACRDDARTLLRDVSETAERDRPRELDPNVVTPMRSSQNRHETALVISMMRTLRRLRVKMDFKPDDVCLPVQQWNMWLAAVASVKEQQAVINNQRGAMVENWMREHEERPPPPPGWHGITQLSKKDGVKTQTVWAPPPDKVPAWYSLALQADRLEQALALELWADLVKSGAIIRRKTK